MVPFYYFSHKRSVYQSQVGYSEVLAVKEIIGPLNFCMFSNIILMSLDLTLGDKPGLFFCFFINFRQKYKRCLKTSDASWEFPRFTDL